MGPHLTSPTISNDHGAFIMEIGCYILYSETLKKHYIGACQDSLERRISKHNTGFYGGHRFTSKAKDWKLILFIPVEDYPHAIRIERKIKAMKSSRYIRNLVKYENLRVKIYNETNEMHIHRITSLRLE